VCVCVCVCAGGSALFHIASSTGCPPLPPVLSPEAHAFLQLAFIRNPRERPTASKLLHHPFIVNPLPAHFQPAQVLTPFQVRKWSMVPISLSYITPFQTQQAGVSVPSSASGEKQSASGATPQVARGRARPPCRHFNIRYCCCLRSVFNVAAFQTLGQM
jgi:serine/threonine protein kinase